MAETSLSDRGGNAAAPPPVIELRNIDKYFGQVHANQQVSLKVLPGVIHGIIGENGAGKSTLMNILHGFYEADGGEIWVDGVLTKITSSADAIAAGIDMVHQHFMLVDSFTVLENIMLGAEGGALLAGGRARAQAELARLGREFGLEVTPGAIVGELPVGLQQRVEILKALYRGAKILILDEPTSVLTPQETEQLFNILRALRDQGVTIVLITHKLREIMTITDTVSVMRGGRMVAHLATGDTDREALAELMVAHRPTEGSGCRDSGRRRTDIPGSAPHLRKDCAYRQASRAWFQPHRVQNQRGLGGLLELRRDPIERGPEKGGLAGTDLSGEENESLALNDAVAED